MWGDSSHCRRTSAATLLALSLVGLLSSGCRAKTEPKVGGPPIKVMRVQNPSDDRSGAEHCASDGSSCRPLAPGQEIPRSGLVRTFAGASVTLDLGQGRRMDLGPLSETKLSAQAAQLTRGDIGVVGTPLIAKESASAFDFVVGKRTFQLDQARGALAHFAVSGDATGVTLRQGHLAGADLQSLSAGDSMRLTSAGAFRTSASGGELSPVPYVGSQRREFGELWPEVGAGAVRGLGTMTGRIPNTQQVLGGVRLAKHKVEVTIVDGIARTEVVEEFENQSQQILEGGFRFPVPSDAAVSRLGLWVNDQLVEGEVVEAKRARAIYESIVDRPVPRDPALLEWVSAGEMSLKVFPILPRKSRRVLLAYDQLLPVEGGRFRYSYPLSLGEGRDNLISELSIAVHVLDTAGAIEGLRVPSHEARMGREGPWTSAYYSERDVRAGRDFVVIGERRGGTYLALDLPSGVGPSVPNAAIPAYARASTRAPGSGHFALRASVDLPKAMARPAAVRADRALVLDVSYSQSRETVRAQAALALAVVSELEPEEGFVLLACDSACAVHSAPPGPIEERRQRARAFLSALVPGGASDLAGALVAGSLELGRLSAGADSKSRQLVLLSDGLSSAGELSAGAIARAAGRHLWSQGIDLRLVGVGRKLDHGRLENLAIELDAALDFLPSAVLLEQRIFEIAIGLRQPVVRGAHVSLPPGLTLAGGSRLPALRLGQEVVLTGEIATGASGTVELAGRLAGTEYRLSVPLAGEAAGRTRSPFVSALFARQRIESLLGAEHPDQHKAEIIRLSTMYRTMSPYTSFLVLENDEMFQRFAVERTKLDAEETASFDERKITAPGMQDKDALSRELEQAEATAKSEEYASTRTRASAGASSPASAPAPSSAPRPASPPEASKPASKAKKAPMDFGDSSASGASEGRRAADPLDPLSDDLGGPWQDVPRHWHRRPARAHLASFAADDVWRTWAAAELERVRLALEATPESRARLEDFVRRHLAQGRFAEAADVARRFVELDPDYLLAQELLSQAAVVAGDHELARRMLDVQVETSPRSAVLHLQAARAFENAGDGVRACAHYRALAELTLEELAPADVASARPGLVQGAVKQRALECWAGLLGSVAGPIAPSEKRGEGWDTVVPQLRVEVSCEPPTAPSDCPAPIVVGPDGSVTSPWTPGLGTSTATSVSLQKVRTGTYFVLLLGGAPGARGKVALGGRYEKTNFSFVAGGLRTVARSEVNFY